MRERGATRIATVYTTLAVVFALGCLLSRSFCTLPNMENVLRQVSPLAILAAGQTFVVLSGHIDLSIGSLVGLVVCVSSKVISGNSETTLLAAAFSLALGFAVGSLQGLIISRTRIHPFILTFGMMSVLQGIILVYTNYQTVGMASRELVWLADGSVGPFPVPALMAGAIVLMSHFTLRETPFGRYVYAVGGNSEYARRSGVNTRAVVFRVYVISGITAAVAGLIIAGRLGAGYPLAGSGYELDALVAVVLGGTSLSGGAGGVGGSIAGAVILSLVSNVLNLKGITSFVQQVIKGLIILGAVAVYTQAYPRIPRVITSCEMEQKGSDVR